MKKTAFVVLGILILAIFTFAIQISIYKWNSTTLTWEVVETLKATATGSFSTHSVTGNVNGFIPISLWDPSYGRINFKLSVDISRIQSRIVFKPNVLTHVYGKWTVDDMYMLFRSNNNMSVSYSLEGDLEGYYTAQVDNPQKPPKDFKAWNKIGDKLNVKKISVSSGTHEFYLWLGFNKTKDKIFVGPVVFDTYIVPDI